MNRTLIAARLGALFGSAKIPKTPRLLALLSDERDRSIVRQLTAQNHWDAQFAFSRGRAAQLACEWKPQVIFYDRDVEIGDWKQPVAQLAESSEGASVVLISRVVDEYLWSEVVRNGGYDVLHKPLRDSEVTHAVALALSYWTSLAKVRK